MSTLETFDFQGVEILAAGGPIRGRGSPPGGDYYTARDLEAIVDAHRELGDELRAVARLGHIRGVDSVEQPAVGWLDRVRLSADGKRLLADVRKLPRKVADVIRAGAYRTRSVELSRVTSQRTGRSYTAVTGLAWLGSTIPAVQTLDDVVALYERRPPATRLAREYSSSPGTSASLASVAARVRELERRSGDVLRRANRVTSVLFVDAAIRVGRVGNEQRETLLRLCEADPDLVREHLRSLPADPARAHANAQEPWTPEREQAWKRDYAARFGRREEEVL